MVKKVFALTLGLLLGYAAMADNYPYPASNIQFWTGSGSNSAVVVISWDDEDASYSPQGFAWGVHFNGTISAHNLLDTIAAYDSRFTFTFSSILLSTIAYHDNTNNIHLTPSTQNNCFYVNGSFAPGVYDNITISDGDMMEVSESCYFDCTNISPASNPNGSSTPTEATIAASDILYWVGTGSNEAVLAVNWADTALAWGYRWNGTATVSDMMSAIAIADPRFGYNAAAGWLNDITFTDGTVSLAGTPGNYWGSTNNGIMDMGMDQTLSSGDFEKWGDPAAGVIVDSMEYGGYWYYTYVYPMTIHPVSVPGPVTPVDATIAANDILFWVGTGSNEAILAVNWADTALAWGYRWNGTATVSDMMSAIAIADPRFGYNAAAGWLNDITFTDGTVSLAGTPGNYWGSTNNGIMDMGMDQTLSSGDFEKWGDPAAGVIVDSMEYGGYWYYTYVYPMTIHPVSVPGPVTPVDATIAANDILFWVGTGSNEAILAVNWADTALAWGYRFSADSVSSATMLADIAAVDPRLTVEGAGFVSDIRFIDTAAGMTDTLGITLGNWWSSLLNGYSDMGTGQVLRNGDLQKWGDPAAGVIVDSMEWDGYWYYTYVFPMAIQPVAVPDTTGSVEPFDPEHGPFCGAAGTEGSTAIAANSTAIVAWATGVELTRGPQNITNPDGPRAGFGGDTNAIGMATMDNTMDAVSLGDGGSALVTFARPIRNGEGFDFAVYENAFGDGSLELAFVEVSTDGQRFVRFPATCLTQSETQLGNAGQSDPTNLNNLAGKYRIGFGTPFDLEELSDSTGINIDSIVYVRIVDVVGSIDPQYGTYDAFGHIINDPWPTPFESSGFDLTGVAVMHERTDVEGIDNVAAAIKSVWPNPTSDYVNVGVSHAVEAVLYDLSGRRVASFVLNEGSNRLDLRALRNGVYMLRAEGSVSKIVKR